MKISEAEPCARWAVSLAASHPDDLSPVQQQALEAHLRTCSQCRAVRADYAAAEMLLHSLPPVTPRADLPVARLGAPARETRPRCTSEPAPGVVPARPGDVPARPHRAPAPRPFEGARRAAGSIAAVLVVALLAAILLASQPGRSGLPSTPTGTLGSTQPVTFSPALADKMVYIGTGNGVYAVAASTGALRWHYPAQDTTLVPVGVSSAVLSGDMLYAILAPGDAYSGSPTLTVVALHAKDGSLAWSKALTSGIGAALAIDHDTVYVTPRAEGSPVAAVNQYDGDSLVYALGAHDGRVLWRFQADEPVISAPTVVGGLVYFVSVANIYAVRTSDGTLVSRSVVGPGAHPEGYSQGALGHAAISVSSTAIFVYATVLRKHDTGNDLRVDANLWTIPLGNPQGRGRYQLSNVGSPDAYPPAVGSDWVYFPGNGGEIDTSSANPDHQDSGWRSTTGTVMVGPVLANSVLYACGFDGYTYALRASDGHRFWRQMTQGGTMSKPPAVTDGALFAAGGGILYALSAQDGAVAWRFIVPQADIIGGAPVVG